MATGELRCRVNLAAQWGGLEEWTEGPSSACSPALLERPPLAFRGASRPPLEWLRTFETEQPSVIKTIREERGSAQVFRGFAQPKSHGVPKSLITFIDCATIILTGPDWSCGTTAVAAAAADSAVQTGKEEAVMGRSGLQPAARGSREGADPCLLCDLLVTVDWPSCRGWPVATGPRTLGVLALERSGERWCGDGGRAALGGSLGPDTRTLSLRGSWNTAEGRAENNGPSSGELRDCLSREKEQLLVEN
ncbi:UNVERIFIED_CONTAM: hypothetical protein K2H54_014821 [Gekko kuhli]